MVAVLALAAAAPLLAHHSFAGFDMTKTRLLTGVVTRLNPDANHLQIYFAPMNEERKNVLRGPDNKPLVWEVEMAGSATAAAEGISVSSFAPGTVFSVAVHPARNGDLSGFREGPLFKCPERTPPKAGLHCDSVEGRVAFGQGKLPTPSN
jgi:hypothetical protein